MEYRLLGPLEVLQDGSPLSLPSGKPRVVLALLLLRASDVVSTDALAEALWGEGTPATAANAIQGHVAQLRRLLGREAIVTRPPGYLLSLAEGDTLDIERFEGLFREGREALVAERPQEAAQRLGEALALFRGTPLSDFRYEGFAQAESARLEELRLACLEDRIEAELALARHTELVGELEALLAERPLRERLHGQRMLALYRAGRQAEALSAYQEARHSLVEELGIEPGEDLQALNRAILTHDPALAVEAPPPSAKTNLPAPPTRLVGRERELAELAELLTRSEVRLLTLTGPGGVGKTRLALALAEQALPHYPDGVFVAFLASLRDPQLVASVVAHALGVREWAGGTPEETLVGYLSERDVLLILDNFEHLLDAAPTASRLLAGARGLTVLVTSREPLHVAGEHLIEVPPLSTPDKVPSTAAEALEHDSVALFVERSPAAKTDFEFDGERVGAVAEICARLDGLPLAIELAAARSRTLSPQALLARLDLSLALLTSGARDSDERQRTLRATIEWSYDLLSEHEKTLFARLAVFAGGCRPDEAEVVGNSDGELGVDVINGLASLVEKSLLHQRDEPDGEPRFWMLETIREYAFEQLQARAELDHMREIHAKSYFALADRAASGLRGGQIAEWLDRLEREMDNLRAVLAWSLDHDDLDSGLQFADALWYFWFLKGHSAELRSWSQAALSKPGQLSSETQAAGLWLLGDFSQHVDDYATAEENYRSSLALYERLEDKKGIVMCLNGLGWLALLQGCYGDGEHMIRNSVAVAREIGHPWHLGFTLRHLGGFLVEQGNYAEASSVLEEALAVAREIDDVHRAEEIFGDFAWLAFLQRDYERAVTLAEESLALARQLGTIPDIGAVAHTLGSALFERGQPGEACTLLIESLIIGDEVGDVALFALALYTFAAIAAASHHGREAARLQGAADAYLQLTGGKLNAAFVSMCEEHLSPVRAHLGEELWAVEGERGRALRRPEIIRFVRENVSAWAANLSQTTNEPAPTR